MALKGLIFTLCLSGTLDVFCHFCCPEVNLRCRSWELVDTLKMRLFLSGSGSLAAMAVFEDKFRPDMEVCKSLQFYSLVTCFFQLYVGHLQIDCQFLQSLYSTVVG